MLNPDIKTTWVSALRSGEYKQTKAVLIRDEDDGSQSFCCLGVLHQVCGIKRQDPADAELLDYTAAEAIGLNRREQNELSSMNDTGRSFAEIADHIEVNL
jgi:hypothetical protein